MATETTDTTNTQQSPANAQTPPDAAQNTDENPKTVPYERFQEINRKMREFETQLKARADADAKLETERKAADETRMAEQQQFKELAEKRGQELEAAKARAKQADDFEALLGEMRDAQMATAPEHIKELLKEFDTVKALRWLTANADKLTPKQAPNTDAGARGERGNTPVNPKDVLKRRSF